MIRRPADPTGTCRYCLAWGLPGRTRVCLACVRWRGRHGGCAGCRRVVPIRDQYCRLCRVQAAAQLSQTRIRGRVPAGVRLAWWQLSFADITSGRQAVADRRSVDPAACTPVTWQIPGQFALFATTPDVLRFNRSVHANPANPALARARVLAQQQGEALGWSRWLVEEVDEALVMLLSGHAPGDRITYSDLVKVDRRGGNVGHTAEILTALGVLDDNRSDTFTVWLDRRLVGLAPGIAADTATWMRTLREGGPRTTPRTEQTARHYLGRAHPHLLAWSTTYQQLREVTRGDIHAVADGLTGQQRKQTLVALRSLFGHGKRTGRLFTDPTTGRRPGQPAARQPLPIRHEQLQQLVEHAVTTAQRLVLALAAVHATRPTTIRTLRLDDVDLPNRRITIAGHTRRLDELTARLAEAYQRERRRRWPHTANPHLLLSERTAHGDQPVSPYWLNHQFHGLGITINQIRIDRQLEEALAHGPDPLHLVAVFGISETAAINYANAARQLLDLTRPGSQATAQPTAGDRT